MTKRNLYIILLGFVFVVMIVFLNMPKTQSSTNQKMKITAARLEAAEGHNQNYINNSSHFEGEPLVKKTVQSIVEKPVQKQGDMQIALAKLREGNGANVLVSSGVPFAKGQLESDKFIQLFDEHGRQIPIATRILARWPQDQSVRSVLIQFHYPIPNLYEYVTLRWGYPRSQIAIDIVDPNWDLPEGIMALSAQWLCDSGVVGPQIPMGSTQFKEYDGKIDKFFPAISKSGLKGDVLNDGYYSTPHTFYQLYVRSGDVSIFKAARHELLHYRDNQIIHEGEKRGQSTSGPKARYLYVQALLDDYLMTGDPKSLEVARWMADYLVKFIDPERAFYPKDSEKFWTERLIAFPFLGILSFYEISHEKKYLNIADAYMDNLYKTQMQWPSRGGFIHNLYAHDPEEGARRDEYGGSPFMTGLLLEPIIKYHQLTGDAEAANSIFFALDWLINEALVAKGDSFKYLTADQYLTTDGVPDMNLLIVHAFGYGYRLTGYTHQIYYDVGQKVFNKGVESGYAAKRKHFNQSFRSSGHYLAYIHGGILKALEEQNKIRELEKVLEIDIAESKQKLSQEVELVKELYVENFDYSVGKFSNVSLVELMLDNDQAGSNGSALSVTSKFVGSDITVGMETLDWNLNNYPFVSVSYLIPKDVPVAIRVQTRFGDWICLGGSSKAICSGERVFDYVNLVDDGAWHNVSINAQNKVKSILPGIEFLGRLEFYTQGNSRFADQFWLDDFVIRP